MNPVGKDSTAEASTKEPGANPISFWTGFLWVLLFWGALLIIRATGLQDLADGYHQGRAVAYVMDLLQNDHWICQYGARNDITSKPPMYTWLAGLSSQLFREPSWLAVALPAALATLGAALLVYGAGRKYFGWQAGLLGALAYLASPLGVRQIGLVRIDGLFAFSIALTALLAFECWRRGKGWTWFWLAATFSTFTKGPLGPLLGSVGLLAAFWEKRSGNPYPIRGYWFPGVGLLLGLCGGWFWLAYMAMGQPLVDVMLGRELVGQVVREQRSGSLPFTQFYLPILYVMRAFVPWVIPGLIGLWRVFRQPDSDPGARRFERFVACWFLGGLFVFSAAAHQRPDLIFPLIPPTAILAGREVARWLKSWSPAKFLRLTAVCAVVALVLAFAKCHVMEKRDWKAVRTTAFRNLAAEIKGKVGSNFPLNFVEGDVILQYYLGIRRADISYETAADLLAGGTPAFVAVPDLAKLKQALGTNSAKLFQLEAWTGKDESLYVVGNYPRLEWTPSIVWQCGPVQVTLENAKPTAIRERSVVLNAGDTGGKVRLRNGPSGSVRFVMQESGTTAPVQNLTPSGEITLPIPAGGRLQIDFLTTPVPVSTNAGPD